MSSVAIHTIPVRNGISAEQAWEEIERGKCSAVDSLGIERPCGWANALLVNGRYRGILPLDQDEAEAMIDRERGIA